MKLSRKSRIIGLSAILAVLVVGLGVLAWQLLAPKGEEIDTPSAEEMDTQVYTETIVATNYDDRIEELTWCDSELVVRVNRDIISVASQEKISKIPTEWEQKYKGLISKTTFDTSGNLYAGTIMPDVSMVMLKHNLDGTEANSEIILDGWKAFAEVGLTPQLRGLRVDENYFYLLSSADSRIYNLQIFTHDGKLFSEYPLIQAFEIDGNGGLYIVTATNSIQKHDVATKEKTYSKPINTKGGSALIGKIALEKTSGQLYVSNQISVQTYSEADGEFIKDAMILAQSAPSWGRGGVEMQVDKDQNIYAATFDAEKSILLKYSIADDTRHDMQYTLTITSPYRDDFMERAITLFEKDNTKQKIKYDYEYNSFAEFEKNSQADGYADRSKIKQLTGDIGDIVLLDNYWGDVHTMLTTDIFMDLTKKVKKDPSYKKLDSVALDAITINGDIRGIPLRSDYFYASINMDLCQEMGIDLDWNTATWSDVLALNEKFQGTDKYLFDMYGNQERTFTRMVISNMPELIDLKTKKIDLRQPWFLDLIEQWKQASQTPNFSQINKRYGLTDKALICIDAKTSNFMESESLHQYIETNEAAGQEIRCFPLFCGEKNTNRTAESNSIYAISERSQNKDNAWEFLSFLLQANVAGNHETKGRAINKEVRAAEFKTTKWQNMDADMEDRYLNDMENIYNSVNYLYDMSLMKQDLYQALLKYFDGTLTLDKALAKAEHDIWIRLNE